MKCFLCQRESVIFLKYLNQGFCSKHFVRMIKKRFMRNLKNLKMWEKNSKLYIPKGKELRLVVLNYLFKDRHFIKTKKNSADKIVKKECMDDLAFYFIKNIFSGKWPELKISNKNIYPLYNISYEELKVFAECVGLKYFKKEPEKNLFLEKVKKIRPGAMFSLVRWLE